MVSPDRTGQSPRDTRHMATINKTPLSKHELSVEIADNGGWEEFYQKRGNYTMFDHHKNLRLKLEKEYRERFVTNV